MHVSRNRGRHPVGVAKLRKVQFVGIKLLQVIVGYIRASRTITKFSEQFEEFLSRLGVVAFERYRASAARVLIVTFNASNIAVLVVLPLTAWGGIAWRGSSLRSNGEAIFSSV